MKRILVLDDNSDILSIVEEILLYEHYNVKSLDTCSGIVKLAEEFNPDLILLDYKLADGNGGELCRMFKSHPQLHAVPVIIFSAYTRKNLNFMDFGCDAVIAKPFDLNDMLQTVSLLLSA